jgi:pimeloyl-ACP methyl ester carboxylesterase
VTDASDRLPARLPRSLSGRLRAVPGLGLDAAAWRPTLEALGLGAGAVTLLPGYGVPVRVGDPVDPALVAARLLDRLPADPPGGVVLAGHSSSCQVVAHAARLAPERVAALVLVGPTTDPRATSWPGLAARWLRTAAHEDPRQVPGLVWQYHRTTLRSMLRVMDASRRDRVDATLATVSAPVLLLRGRHDRICPADWLHGLARSAPPGADRTVVTLPRGAHMVPITHPQRTARQVAELLLSLA